MSRTSAPVLSSASALSSSPRGDEQNGFDGLRLGLAALVVYSHAHFVGGLGTEGFFTFCRGQTIAGTFAVLGFFGISGFLVTRSFVLQPDWRRFSAARFLRILPALYFALLVTAFVIAPLISAANPASTGWKFADALRYFTQNLFVRVGEWHVGGVTAGLPGEGSINGALWSLFPELVCYGLVLGLGLVGALTARLNALLAFGLLVVLHVALVLAPDAPQIAPTLLRLTGWAPYVTAFATGSVLFLFRDVMRFGPKLALGWAICAVILLRFGGWGLLGPLVLPLLAINLAHSFTLRLRADFSYGLYVLHFPVFQLLAAWGAPSLGLTLYLVLGAVGALALAAVSWYGVERPALRIKRRFFSEA